MPAFTLAFASSITQVPPVLPQDLTAQRSTGPVFIHKTTRSLLESMPLLEVGLDEDLMKGDDAYFRFDINRELGSTYLEDYLWVHYVDRWFEAFQPARLPDEPSWQMIRRNPFEPVCAGEAYYGHHSVFNTYKMSVHLEQAIDEGLEKNYLERVYEDPRHAEVHTRLYQLFRDGIMGAASTGGSLVFIPLAENEFADYDWESSAMQRETLEQEIARWHARPYVQERAERYA